MEAQFAALEGFESVEFVDGIPSRSLRRKEDLRAALEEAELVQPGDDQLHATMWLRCRSLSRERAVLACYLAHLRAIRQAVQSGADVIFEDNVRMPARPPGEAARRIRACIEASPQAELRLYGFGGRKEDLEAMYAEVSPKTAALPLPFRFVPDGHAVVDSGPADVANTKRVPVTWGAYAYWISPRGWATLLHRIQSDVLMAVVAPKGKNLRGFMVRPIDKILPARCVSEEQERSEATAHISQEGIGSLLCSTPPSRVVSAMPCCYRAPMLRSTIHEQWDASFCEATVAQMRACASAEDSFDRLWLSVKERNAVEMQSRTGEWIHNDGLVKGTWENVKLADPSD